MINTGQELMTIGDMLNAIGLAGIFIIYMIPVSLIVSTIVIVTKIIKRNKEQSKIKKELKRERKEAIKIIEDENKAMEVIKNEPEEPVDKSRFSSLKLEFNEEGYVRQ